jgi:hypothetical protein
MMVVTLSPGLVSPCLTLWNLIPGIRVSRLRPTSENRFSEILPSKFRYSGIWPCCPFILCNDANHVLSRNLATAWRIPGRMPDSLGPPNDTLSENQH